MARLTNIRLRRSATAGNIPTTSQLDLGELALNTTDGKLYLKREVGGVQSVVEVGGDEAGAGVWNEYVYTATSNQTSFSGSDDNSQTLSYIVNYIQVFLNGILLDNGTDYTATNNISIVLVNGASAGDTLQISSFVKVIGSGDIAVDTFTPNGSTAAFTLSTIPSSEENLTIFIDGVYQEQSTYSVSSNTLTLDANPSSGTTVEVIIGTNNVTLTDIADLTIAGDLTAVSLDISGNIDVDGTTNLDVVDIDGAVDMASTLQVTGAITANGGLLSSAASAGVNAFSAGPSAGTTSQGRYAVATGFGAGQTTQGEFSVAIGRSAGNNTQSTSAVAIGNQAGLTTQSTSAVAVGILAGTTNQGASSVAIGGYAGKTNQSTSAVAVGRDAGKTTQGAASVAVGSDAGETTQGASSVAIGDEAGKTDQGADSVSIGHDAGKTTQGISAVAVGKSAGLTTQGAYSVAAGRGAGQTNQGAKAVAAGYNAGNNTQGGSAVAIGNLAGQTNQSTYSVAFGYTAGQAAQGGSAVAVGREAGQATQGTAAVAMGYLAGSDTQGASSVAIGRAAGQTDQGANGILINSSGSALNDTSTGHIRLKSSTGELSYTTAAGWNMSGNVTVAGTLSTGAITGTTATATGGTNTTAIASTAFVQQELTTLIGGAPGTLDTLNELAAAINDDDDYHTTLTTALATKLPLSGGTLTGTLAMGANAITSTGTISSGVITATGGNSTNWNTAYTVANAALPKAGGTLTGDVTFAAGAELITTTAGTSNLRLGVDAGTNLASGSTGNTFVGDNAGKDTTTGDNNVAVGKGALENNITSSSNVAVGMEALFSNTTGQSNSAIGFRTLYANTTGSNNMGIGQASLRYSTTGNNNLAIGVQSVFANTTGSSNVGLGLHALYTNVTGNYNTASGTQALKFTTAADNTAMGGQAGMAVTSGTLNSFFGKASGSLVTTGSKNTILGAFDGNENGLDIRTSSNNIVLADGDGNPRLIINSSGAATFASTVNGRNIATDGTKLDGIEASATADQTNAEIRTAVEAASDSNVFTDADHSKLGGIATNANNYVLPSSIATQSYVGTQISNLVDSSPAALNTLNELAAAIGDDASFSTTVTNNIATKLPKAGGTMTGNLNMGDNVKAQFGTGNDLQIYHDGSHSYIKDTATGNLRIDGTNIQIRSTAGANLAAFVTGAEVQLYHNNAKKFETTATGIDVTGRTKATYFNATSTAVTATSGNAYLVRSPSNGAVVYGYGTSRDATLGNRSGAVALGVVANTTNVSAYGDFVVAGNLATGGDVTIENATPILDMNYTGTSGRIDFNNSSDAVKSRIIYTEGTGLSIGANGTAAAIKIADGTNDVSVAGDLLLDTANAEVNLKAGAGGTSGAVNWTFNTTGTNYASIKLPYDTRNTTGLHIDAGYPITIDATAEIKFAVSGNNVGTWNSSGLDVAGTTTGTGGFNLPNNTPIRGVPTGGGTVRMLRLNTSNQVEVGSTNDALRFTSTSSTFLTGDVAIASGRLNINTGGSAVAAPSNVQAVISHTDGFANVGLALVSGTGNSADLFLGDTTNPKIGYVSYANAGNKMSLGVSAGTKFTMTTTDAQFSNNNLTKLWGTAVDVSITRGNGTSGAIDIYRNNGNNPWSIVGGQSGVTLDLELDYMGVRKGDFNSTSGNYTPLSLRKFKDNIEDVVDPFEIIRRLRPRTYSMSGVETAGYIYDEVDGVLDRASVDTGINHSPVGVNHDAINTYTTAAVQRLIVASEAAAAEITQLKAEIQELRGLI